MDRWWRAAQRPPETVEKESKERMVTPATVIPHTLEPIKFELGNVPPEGSNASRKLLFSSRSQVTPPIAVTVPQDTPPTMDNIHGNR
ncbi:hypothetical protein RND71_002102 [Anisodus tanguticus]|uniref:Uncharacterized protein n=1 Tax=Anisodus tanguticus TaxID=243964 RepID=A0AAE1T2G1_9SOLA|nr:hypothetical protein RND71_002102 [Anisodus tanguticus]